MTTYLRALLASAILGMAIPSSVAQTPFFRTYHLLKKNEPVHVYTMFQDREGFMWYGTDKGLFRFDGVRYRRLTKADSLPDDHVTALAQDRDGRIWSGHSNGKLACIEHGIMKAFSPAEGSAAAEVSDILFDNSGRMWFSTRNDGLYVVDGGRLHRIDEAEGMPDLFIYDLAEDSAGRVWAGTDGGVAVCSWSGGKAKVIVINDHNGLPDNIVKKVVVGTDGRVWMGTEDRGVICFDPRTQRCEPVAGNSWPYGVVTDFAFRGSEVWISCRHSGLVIYDSQTRKISNYSPSVDPVFASLTVLACDREGGIWAATKTGMIRLPGNQVSFIRPSADANILAVCAEPGGAVWYSTPAGLFKRSVGPDGTVTTQRMLQGTPYAKHTVISLYADAAGYVWAGFYGEGVIRINARTGAVRHLDRELRNGNVLNITGSGSTVWLATLGGGSRIDVSGESLQVQNYGKADGLILDYIYQVFVDSRGRVWFATDGKGVDMLDEKGFHHFRSGLHSQVIYSIAEDAGRHIWVNAQGDGLYQFDGNTFYPFRGNRWLRDHNISSFTFDRKGNLVVMHDLGIDIYDMKQKRMRCYGEEAGIYNRAPNLNAIGKDDGGNIYFGTDEGLIRYNDRADQVVSIAKPVIEGVRALDHNFAAGEAMDLGYDENDITINYLGFWFRNPENLNYLYQLSNYDREWISSRNRSVTYSSLPPGEYVFRLKVSDTEDFSGAAETSVRVVIRPPFWKTPLFYSACVVTGMALLYILIRVRESRLQEDKRRLEEKVAERTLEIQNQNEEIQAQYEEIQAQYEEIQYQADEIRHINENLEDIVQRRTMELERKNKALEEYAFINAHQLRSPVASILGLVNIISNEESPEQQQIIISHLKESSEKLDSIVASITRAIESKA